MKARHVLVVSTIAIAAAVAAYFGSASGSPKPTLEIGGGGAPTQGVPNTAVGPSSGLPPAARPQATALAPTSSLAGVGVSALASGLQADFNQLLSGDSSALKFDSQTKASAVSNFLKADGNILNSVNVTPTITSATLNADGSQTVTFTVVVTVGRGTWPTNFGTLTATLNPDATFTLPRATICTLTSPLIPPVPPAMQAAAQAAGGCLF